MNKETIYIEPGDDITDILARLKSSEKKVIALVPPKKAGVLLSSVNIRLIARAAKMEKKAVVLVTTDDSLTKLAMGANLPVAPSLKSRPVMPDHLEEAEKPKKSKEPEETDDSEDEDERPEEELEDSDDSEEEADEEAGETEKISEKSEEVAEEFTDEPEASKLVEEIESEEEEEKSDSKKSKKASKKEKPEKKKKEKKESGSPIVAWLNAHLKWLIFGIVAVAALVAFFIWALMIAPHVSVAVTVRTSSGNFSENVTFTKSPADENSESGVFYAHEEKLEKEQTVKFTATGQKDLGDKATGSLIVYTYFNQIGSIPIPAGTIFKFGGLEYTSTADVSLDLERTNNSTLRTSCDNFNDDNFDLLDGGCLVSATVSIIASAPGESYNVDPNQTSGWSINMSGIIVYNASAISGGTSKVITVVQQSDVDLALDKLANDTKESGKNELLAKLSDTILPIDASFKASATAPTSTPAVGEEVPEGTTPTISSKATYTILTVDMVRIEEFIKNRTNLEENRRMYSIGSPFVEYFTESDENTYSAKLKTSYKTGPKISETEVLEKVSGEKIGRIEPVLKDAFPGIASVAIEKSYFWVNSVPTNPNQVTINMEVEE
ncbi:hypothetical protein IJ380_02385 [Candidatus Saccharibacteria bacterium]|nr:hypothetical protein [Candidatus Saccharibacteria bacterium]